MLWTQAASYGLLPAAVITFGSIYGIEIKVDHATFPTKTKSIKRRHLAKAVSLSWGLGLAGPLCGPLWASS